MSPSRPRTFAVKVCVIILVPAVALALVLGKGISSAVGSSSLDQAQRQASVAAQALGEPSLARAASVRRPSHGQRRRVERALSRLTRSGDVLSARVIDRKGRVAYSTQRSERGGMLRSAGLSKALAGAGKSEKTDIAGQKMIDSYVPLHVRASDSAAPAAVSSSRWRQGRSSRRWPARASAST